MTEYDWFWDNYEKSMDWINHHQVAFWKSQAIALKTENELLKETISRAQKRKGFDVKLSKRKRKTSLRRKRRLQKEKRSKQHQECRESHTSDFDVEVSPELIEFLRISMKHKEQRRKEKEEQDALTSFVPPQDVLNARMNEMKCLYGEDSLKIVELEKAMTRKYEKFIDRKCPEYWPKLPLNLKA